MFNLFGKSKEGFLFSYAKKGNMLKMVELIEEGVPIDIFQKNTGLTPLVVAAENGNHDCVKGHLDRGANVNLATKGGPDISNDELENNSVCASVIALGDALPDGSTLLS